PDHIACDSAANSEIVIPIFVDNKVYAVLDLDSTKFARFTKTDQLFLEEIAKNIGDELEKIVK
ncbi:MAG: GAF domain-containing protein, partial [Bacilli bacterium]